MSKNVNSNTVVIAIIEKDGKIMISKVREDRVEDFGGLEYVFPGGRVESGETLEEAVVRELKEETNLDIEPIAQISLSIDPVTQEDVYYFHCQIKDKDLNKEIKIMNSNTAEILWVTKGELDMYHNYYNPDVKEFIDTL